MDILTPLMAQLGMGGVGGFLVGYALKITEAFGLDESFMMPTGMED